MGYSLFERFNLVLVNKRYGAAAEARSSHSRPQYARNAACRIDHSIQFRACYLVQITQ
ncbi:hypothetical protein D3C85_1805880 [compost metagenome]